MTREHVAQMIAELAGRAYDGLDKAELEIVETALLRLAQHGASVEQVKEQARGLLGLDHA